MTIERTAKRIINLFNRIDRRILVFRNMTGLSCPRCSGRCCEAHFIEVTPLDVLPVALHMKRLEKLEGLLRKLDGKPKMCIFFSKRQTDIKNCHCKIYPLRPTTCRIFGFGTLWNKNNQQRLTTCKNQKRHFGTLIQRIESNNNLLKKTVAYTNVSMLLYHIDPSWGSMHMHINDALKLVIEKLLFMRQITGRPFDQSKTPRKIA